MMKEGFVDKLFDLSGHRAVVIGGAGGLGSYMAEGLAVAGATVAVASRVDLSQKKNGHRPILFLCIGISGER